MSSKKRLIVVIFSVLIYFLLTFLYNNVLLKQRYLEAYMLKENISRGQTLSLDNLEKVYLKNSGNNNLESLVLKDNFGKYVSKNDITKGSIVLKEDFLFYDEYNKANEGKEIISIKISNPEDFASYQVEKNSIVNIYYTGKSEFANNILNNVKSSYISTNNKENKLNSGYITVKLASDVKVINLFDKYGNIVQNKIVKKGESNKIDTVMLELDKDLVMSINNLKNYGEFSITVKR